MSLCIVILCLTKTSQMMIRKLDSQTTKCSPMFLLLIIMSMPMQWVFSKTLNYCLSGFLQLALYYLFWQTNIWPQKNTNTNLIFYSNILHNNDRKAFSLWLYCWGYNYNIIWNLNQTSFMLIDIAFGQTMAFRIIAWFVNFLAHIGHFDKN